jgi:hypothetical protein
VSVITKKVTDVKDRLSMLIFAISVSMDEGSNEAISLFDKLCRTVMRYPHIQQANSLPVSFILNSESKYPKRKHEVLENTICINIFLNDVFIAFECFLEQECLILIFTLLRLKSGGFLGYPN